MNQKHLFLSLLCSTFIATVHAGQTGNLTFNNHLTQPIQYEFTTNVTGDLGAIRAAGAGITVKGRGEVPAQTSKNIPSSLFIRSENVWGDSINFILHRNQNESYPFTINQLGTYTINIDQNNKIILEK